MKRPSGNFDVDKYVKRVLPASWLHYLPLPISWFFGYRRNTPKKRPDVIIYVWTWIGAFCGVSVIEAVFQRNPYFSDRGVPIIVGSFGATAVLLYGAIEAPFAQPRAVFFGHTFSAIIGVCVTKLFETNEGRFLQLRWLAGAIACATASVVMAITKTIHPPSGATAMIAATQADIAALGWYYIPVVMLSAALAIGVGLITNNIQRRYPVFWLLPERIPTRKEKVEAKEMTSTTTTPPPAPEPTPEQKKESHETPTLADIETEYRKNHVIVSRSNIFIPEFLGLEDEHLQVLDEIQQLLDEHQSKNSSKLIVDGMV